MEESTAPTSAPNAVDPTRQQGNTQQSNSENSNFHTSGSNSSGSSGYGGKAISSSPSTAQKDIKTMGDNVTITSTNPVDSSYSQSNGRSLSSESSQCRMQGSDSSGSSGYGGKQTTSMSADQAENSASSGNSAELTTLKDLKRSKNKGRKKKPKTKQSKSRQNKKSEPIQETQSQETKSTNDQCTSLTLEQQAAFATDPNKSEDAPSNVENKLNQSHENITNVYHIDVTTETDLQKESASDFKLNQDHSAIPLSSSESLKDKTDKQLDEESSALDKSPDDLEVDNILSHSKVEEQTAEHRASLIQESFCCAVSMHDGIILSTTANLTDSLGFPKDVWLGRAFIDFVHPKDRTTFASQITSRYIDHNSLEEDYSRESNFEKTPLHVLLRCYRGFDTHGFGIKNKPVSYKPFKLIFRKAPEMLSSSVSKQDGNRGLRIICAIALSSIYKVPDEAMKKQNVKFSTRHTAAGVLVQIDGTSVDAIGYMPQDIIGESILDFFHPDDMMLLKTANELLMKNTQVADGRVSTPPYRFLIKNGCYITLETEWTKVFNPWSRKLEFVTGDHCVLQGPNHCDIFTETGKFACKFSNEILQKAAIMRKEFLNILSEPVPYPSDSVKQQVSKRCQALATFMESLLVGVKRQELKLDLLTECEPAASEHGSVMLGEISPHHHSNHDDSKSSSETPPTYNQLNYYENLSRFFNSVHPTFVPNEFKSLSHQIDHVPTNEKDRMLSPIQQSGEESGGSFNSSSDSPRFESTNTSNTSNNGNTNQKNVILTEAIVSRHTDDMEVQMVKNHEKYRSRSSHMTDKKKTPNDSPVIRNQPVKRSWENERGKDKTKNSNSHNQNEHRYTSNNGQNAQVEKPTAQSETLNNEIRSSTNALGQATKVPPAHLWPPFSVNATTIQNNMPTNTIPNPMNQFLLPNHLSSPRNYVPSNNLLEIDQPANVQSNVIPTSLSNPYALNYLKNLMSQPHPFTNRNLLGPYPPIAYQPLPMIQQRSNTTIQASGATNVSLDVQSTSLQAIRKMPQKLPKMEKQALFDDVKDTEPVNLSMNAYESNSKLQVKSWAKMKDENSEEVDASNSSFGSSFFDSHLRTDESWESDKTSKDYTMDGNSDQNTPTQEVNKRGKIPHWMKNVDPTQDLVLRYQVKTKELQDTLQADLRVLREISQPCMVNDQLDQLYMELSLEKGHTAQISLGDTPSDSSEDEENMTKKKKNTHYSKLSMIYDENAPVQPPV